MSKSATVAATVTMTSPVQGEQVQLDIGPYATANINVSPSLSSTSPGSWLVPTNLNVTSNPLALSNSNLTPLPIYLIVSPLQVTNGTILTLQGAISDVGVAISSVNPSFIPAQARSSGGDTPQITPPLVYLKSSAITQLEIGWV